METKLRTLQLTILDIALEFQRICEENNIKYFLIGGTLLGAVRHKGFIPWDDDMDVGMLREEYEKFLEICSKELEKEFSLQTYESDKYHTHPFAKIRINNTLLIEDYAVNSKQNNGIYLDIFPYDNMPDNKFLQKIHYFFFKLLKWAAMGKNDYCFVEKKKRRFAKAMSIVFFFFSKKKTMQLCEKTCKMFNNKKTKNVINMGGAYKYKEFTLKSNLENLTKLEFEGYEFSVPVRYKELLTNMYGDYMQLPPVEQRGNQHSMVNIDIGNYQIKNKNYKIYCECIQKNQEG